MVLSNLGWDFDVTESLSNIQGQSVIDVVQALDHSLLNDELVTLAQFELSSADHVLLLHVGERVVEHRGLGVVVLELGTLSTLDDTGNLGRVAGESTFGNRSRCEVVVPVREVRSSVLLDEVLVLTISVIDSHRANGPIDWEVTKVDTETSDLGVKVGEVPTGQQWIIGEVDTWNDVLSTESDLFSLGKVVVSVSVEFENTDILDGDEILWDEFR